MMTRLAATKFIPKPPARVEMRNKRARRFDALLKILHQFLRSSAVVDPSNRK